MSWRALAAEVELRESHCVLERSHNSKISGGVSQKFWLNGGTSPRRWSRNRSVLSGTRRKPGLTVRQSFTRPDHVQPAEPHTRSEGTARSAPVREYTHRSSPPPWVGWPIRYVPIHLDFG